MKQSIYLDYAAATPLDERAFASMKPYFSEQFFNPSAVYQSAREVNKAIEAARAVVSSCIGSKDQEVVFTAGGTEANNLAIHGIMRQFPDGNIIVSSIEHDSVLAPANVYERRIAPVNKKGILDLAALESLIDENTVLVSIMLANNEIGTIQPIKEVAKIVAKIKAQRSFNNKPIYLHTDACQAANYLDIHVSRLGIDLMTLNGGKIYGPKQSGALYVRAGTKISPIIYGGGQEDGLRSGTENVASIIGFATMLQNVQADRKEESFRLHKLSNDMFATLSQKLKGINLNGDSKKRLPNNINILIESIDSERLVMELDEAGLMVSSASACSASNGKASHVLTALGLSDNQANSSIRLSLGRGTTSEQADTASEILIQVITQHNQLV